MLAAFKPTAGDASLVRRAVRGRAVEVLFDGPVLLVTEVDAAGELCARHAYHAAGRVFSFDSVVECAHAVASTGEIASAYEPGDSPWEEVEHMVRAARAVWVRDVSRRRATRGVVTARLGIGKREEVAAPPVVQQAPRKRAARGRAARGRPQAEVPQKPVRIAPTGGRVRMETLNVPSPLLALNRVLALGAELGNLVE